MVEAFSQAGRSPSEVDFIELHATGTAKGDPTEVNWVGEEFFREGELLIGSVKGNIGHTEITSFLVSLSKVLSILEHQFIPPNVNLSTLNPAIHWNKYNISVPLEPTPLPRRNFKANLIAMTSSGIGGSNGHLVLERPLIEANSTHSTVVSGPILLMAGGLSLRSTFAVADSIRGDNTLKSAADASVISLLLGRRVKQMTWRSFSVVDAIEDISSSSFCHPRHCNRLKPSLLFVFSGQGPQHIDMGRKLFETYPVFRDSVLEMDSVHVTVTGKSLITDFGLFGGSDTQITLPESWPISLILPSIAVFQMALFDLLLSLGMTPDVMLGHSAGETSLFYACGAGPKAMAVELAIIRGQIFSAIERLGGTMAAMSCSPEKAQGIISKVRERYPDHVLEIACYNSPDAVALAGHVDAVDFSLELAGHLGIFGRKIRTSVPIHSSMMESCHDEYVARLDDLFDRYPGDHTPKIQVYSTFTAQLLSQSIDSQYFWRNTRGQVQFTQTIGLIRNSTKSFTAVEISPHPVLASYLSSMSGENSVLHTMHRPKHSQPSMEHKDILRLCGNILLAGHNCIDFNALTRTTTCTCISMPHYPFQKKRFPLYPDTPGAARQTESRRGPLNHSNLRINAKTHPILGEHIIRGEPIMPAAGFMEMAAEFGGTSILDMTMHSILSLSSDTPLRIEVTLEDSLWTVHSLSKAQAHPKHLHASGYISRETPRPYPSLDINFIRSRCDKHISSNFYDKLAYFSAYGPHMQRVTNMYYNSKECLLSLRGSDTTLQQDGAYILHPAILDSCIQVCGQRSFHGNFCPNSYYLPAHLDALVIHGQIKPHYFPAHLYAHIILKHWSLAKMIYDITLMDDLGRPLVTLHGMTAERHSIHPILPKEASYLISAGPKCISTSGRFLVISRHTDAFSPPALGSKFSLIFSNSSYTVFEMEIPPCSCPEPFSPDTAFIMQYICGREEDIQWEFNGLNPSQELNIWLIAVEGPNGEALWGFARALRQEYLLWTIHAVVFPFPLSDTEQLKWLGSLPYSATQELDITFNSSGTAAVPRLLPLMTRRENKELLIPSNPKDSRHIGINIFSHFPVGEVAGFIASVVEPNGATILNGSTIAGLHIGPIEESLVVNIASVAHVPTELQSHASSTALMGSTIAVISLGVDAFKTTHPVSCSVLVTHADTILGRQICRVYAHIGLTVAEMPASAHLLDLGCQGYRKFDLVVSGYDDDSHNTFLSSLLRPISGRLFSWNGNLSSLHTTLLQFPYIMEDVICVAMSLPGFNSIGIDRNDIKTIPAPPGAKSSDGSPKFNSEGVYILHGGIGSLGAHIALFMYEHGARHIILTSRSGSTKDLFVSRMVCLLKSLDDLDIQLIAVDGTSAKDMKEFISKISNPIRGCILLTAVLRDRIFPSLTESDFKEVFAAKTGVFHVLEQVLKLETLDFVVGFSSVSGMTGWQGQANYAAANTALEGAISSLKTGFSFICPAISDSSLMQYGDDGLDLGRRELLEWSFTSQNMIQWFSDAMYRFQHGQLSGVYVPSLNWEVLDQSRRGATIMAQHLVPSSKAREVVAADDFEQMANIVKKVLDIPSDDFSAEIPFTSYGIDSLSALQLSFSLRSFIDVSQIQLLGGLCLNGIYSRFLGSKSQANTAFDKAVKSTISPASRLQETLTRMLDMLPRKSISNLKTSSSETANVVLLTGSTGGLGCAILAQLLSDISITHVFALVQKRSHSTPISRQADALIANGYSESLLDSSKVTVIEGNLNLHSFGLDADVFIRVHNSVTHIIHNGRDGAILLEEPLADPGQAISTGYAESKWVAEQIIHTAHSLSGVNTCVLRVGLLCGSVNGIWDTNHWFPSLVQSSDYVGCLPDGDTLVSWLPMEMAAAAIVDLRDSPSTVVNIVHPCPIKWGTLMGELAEYLHVPLIPYAEWFGCLEGISREQVASSKTSSAEGAIKLLDMFREGVKPHPSFESMGLLPTASFTKALDSSPTLKRAQQKHLERSVFQAWVDKWRMKGFLRPI
ncbi:CurK protein [Gymnopus androsaceus JB14]|uniref:CurK protein n=1 Tax=Gymnopus androsaceus JB14 TaxID=1447944 RepID=A0A6A4HAR7_9AGAR|nr:CurK protein [Gymnopus androsaceus JB14]